MKFIYSECASNCLKCDIRGENKCDDNGCKQGFAVDVDVCSACQNSAICSRCSEKNKCDSGACIGNYIYDSSDKLCKGSFPIVIEAFESNLITIYLSTACHVNCKTGKCTTNGVGKCDVGQCQENYILDGNNDCQRKLLYIFILCNYLYFSLQNAILIVKITNALVKQSVVNVMKTNVKLNIPGYQMIVQLVIRNARTVTVGEQTNVM